jgi:L-fucose isomerase-like protein
MEKVMFEKVGVKVVYAAIVHKGSHEGPCRAGEKMHLTTEFEKKQRKEGFESIIREVKKSLKEDAEILEPVYIEYAEDFVIKERELSKLDKEIEQVDLFLIFGGMRVFGIERYNKPVAMLGKGVSNVDVSAYFRSRGLEGYAVYDFEELNNLISLLRVRKAIQKTRILRISGGEEIPWGVVSSIYDFKKLKEKYGTEVRTLLFEELFEEMDKIIAGNKKEAEKFTDSLMKNAKKVYIEKKGVIGSVYFYLTAKKLMERYGCNAFTTSCFELCSTTIPEKKKFTPCLTHILLKDEGYPSACEEDVSVLFAMAFLMYLSKKSSYMGNPNILDKKKNVLEIHHDMPGLKMYGLNEKPLPYEIRPFTHGGWGISMRYDFSRDKGKTVTLGRFDPTANKMLLIKGEIIKGNNFKTQGPSGWSCILGVDIKISDGMEYFHRTADFGHHLAMVYGDYTEEIKKLGSIMQFEVVEI